MAVAFDEVDRLAPTRRPDDCAAGYQRWIDLLFLHWRVSPAEVAAQIPPSLCVDIYDGCAWIGIVAFRMTGVRPWWSPPIPGISAFAETNVRTYVHLRGQHPGVWFLSLDAGSSLGARLGRMKWGLPYHRSAMRVRRNGSRLRYTCNRLRPGNLGVGGVIEAEIGDFCGGFDCHVDLGRAIPGSLDHFLVERYILYSQKKTRLFAGRVHHVPYTLREGRVIECEQSFLSDLGFAIDRPPDHVVFSPGVSTEVFPLGSTAASP